MFRVVKAFDNGDTAYFLLCDHRQCMEARRGPAVVANPDDYRLTKQAFIKSAIAEGWWIDLEGAYCPPHARDLVQAAREAVEKGKQVVEATPGHVAAFGRSR